MKPVPGSHHAARGSGGKIFLLIIGIVAAIAAPACGDSNPVSPTGTTTTTTTFTVYNHTAGRLGSWSATLPSGTQVTLDITAPGEVVDDEGNVVQAAVAVDSAAARCVQPCRRTRSMSNCR